MPGAQQASCDPCAAACSLLSQFINRLRLSLQVAPTIPFFCLHSSHLKSACLKRVCVCVCLPAGYWAYGADVNPFLLFANTQPSGLVVTAEIAAAVQIQLVSQVCV
jgi:hypothetical protein